MAAFSSQISSLQNLANKGIYSSVIHISRIPNYTYAVVSNFLDVDARIGTSKGLIIWEKLSHLAGARHICRDPTATVKSLWQPICDYMTKIPRLAQKNLDCKFKMASNIPEEEAVAELARTPGRGAGRASASPAYS